MAPSAKTVRAQLALLSPLLKNCSLKTIRRGQNRIGELMEAKYRGQVIEKIHTFPRFSAAWILPQDQRREGVILYLHGGGYTCGDLDYATGFGSGLCQRAGVRVLCAGYRLAPEHPFPAALEDALECYRYLLDKGYAPEHIALCGESAGGGLCYALCLKLKELGLPQPCGIIAISPWTDLTASGESYEKNREQDPSMALETLDFYASCYTQERENPLVSPLFGDLTGLPPSLIFVGGDEILLSDSQSLHEKLLSSGCKSQLIVHPERWHAYLLYGLSEDQADLAAMDGFLDTHLSAQRKLRWLRLDNAAKIYPAARRENWSSIFRVSVTLTEDIDTDILRSALDVTVRRFPSIAARLRRGAFWYYLQQLHSAPPIRPDSSYPLVKMSRDEIRQCAFRVLVYKKRIALEVFHSLTDGTGALVFLKSLTAEYLQQRYHIHIPAEKGVLGRLEEPSEAELEDSFQKYAGTLSASRKETDAWQLSGTPEKEGFLNLTCFILSSDLVREKAREYGVTVTTFLTAVMMLALQNLQAEQVPNIHRRKAIKVQVPINLRRLFPSRSLRNFALYTTPELLTRLGEYSFPEIVKLVHHHLGANVTAKKMSMLIATNLGAEKLLAVKLMPLFLKNIVMKAVFDAVGEKKSCLSLSNLGDVQLPEGMAPYVQRFDLILGVQATAPHNCGVLSYGGKLYLNFIRNTREADLEYHFHKALQSLGLTATVESNRGCRKGE